MKLMVIDTALGACLAGVFSAEGETLEAHGVRCEEMTKGHQERLGGMARDAVAEAGGMTGVSRIGVTVGPGSFTGLRVGLSFALGLGAALEARVVGISTLDGLAASVPAKGRVVAAIDARRGQVYMRMFENGTPTSPAEALPIETAVAQILAQGDASGVTIVGSGGPVLVAHSPELARATLIEMVAPLPEALARLTAELDPEENPPRPIYLRAPDATPPTRLPGQPRPAVR